MRCYGLISGIGSEARFSFPANHSLPTTPILPDSCSRLSFRPFGPITVSPVRARYASLKTKATINDEFLTEPEAAAMSFYELLGIPESGTLLEIKQAYKSLARKYHPDVSPPGRVKEYTRRFIWVQEAYETLSDPQRRALYDRDLAMGLHLAFSARKTYHRDEGMVAQKEWRNRWEGQLSELKRRSMNKDAAAAAGANMSWGARMRMQRNQAASADL
ncbi:hypothetical protein VitviT2T_007057 [Vitis vinifera]|uniref:J domain-containing protein n=2 Tax=Vitis vinifera TaxID=29760 RepID=A5AR44_VITVI|eukprot:XP_002264154.1 PREDICTED: chaperone protein dnaJ 20, chloroplastic [Vitis vinifera]